MNVRLTSTAIFHDKPEEQAAVGLDDNELIGEIVKQLSVT